MPINTSPDLMKYIYGEDKLAAVHYFHNANKLYAGENTLVNAATKLVSKAMVGPLGEILYISHYDKTDPTWRYVYRRACNYQPTSSDDKTVVFFDTLYVIPKGGK